MKEIEKLALEELERDVHNNYSPCRFCYRGDFEKDLFKAGFRKALELAFHTAVQWPNNPSLDTMEEILCIGEKEVK